LAQHDPESTIQGREPGSPSALGEDGELPAEGKLDEDLLTLAAEVGPKRVEQGDREREQDHHGGGEPARSRAHSPDCRGWLGVRYALPVLTQQRPERPIR
jgi:hypothetical protein